MAAQNDTLTKIFFELGRVLHPLEDAVSSPQAFATFAQKLGWDVDDVPQPIKDLGKNALVLNNIISDAVKGDFKLENALQIKEAISKIIQAINAINTSADNLFPAKLRADNFKTVFPIQLIEYLLTDYLNRYQSTVLSSLKAFGIIKIGYVLPQGNRPGFIQTTFDFNSLPTIFQSPGLIFKNAFGWGTPEFNFAEFSKILENLFSALNAEVLTALIPGEVYNKIARTPSEFQFSNYFERALKIVFFERQRSNGDRLEAALQILKLPVNGVGSLPGFVILPVFNGATGINMDLGPGITFAINSEIDIQGGLSLLIRPDQGVTLLSGFNNPGVPANLRAGLNVRADYAPGSTESIVILGSSTGSRVDFKGMGLQGGFAVRNNQDIEIFSEFQLKQFRILIDLKNGDGFLQKIIPIEKIESVADLTLGVSTQRGLYFVGSGGLEILIPSHFSIGPIEINSLTISLKPASGGITLPVGLSLKAVLGPLNIVVENIGIEAKLKFPPSEKFIGFGLGFKPPNGVGLSIDAGVVKGGGYLKFDFDKEEYSGALELTFSGFLSLKAVGMITTKMPDGSKGFSLIIIITAEFGSGIQLGFGFTLLGVGGLLGLNRSMKLDLIAAGIRTGGINSILFPQNVVANAPRIISDLRAYFPPQEGKFLIGPMAKLGWGTPTLVSLSLGVIIEIPGNVAIVGVLRVVLPKEEAALIVINVGFIGALEFDKNRLWFYAELFDSRILFLTLSGGMGLLMDYGDNPNFVLSVGGFHPLFQPPPLPFPNPQRLQIDVLRNPLQRITVQAYFAVTSNTVQFGAQAELFFGVSAFNINGHFSFDALFQFSPFRFVIQVSFSVGITVFGFGLFSISLRFQLEGPAPWRAQGTGTLTIDLWLFEINITASFDITWGEAENPTLPDVKVLPKLVGGVDSSEIGEFNKLENWKAKLPASSNLLVSLRTLKEDVDKLVLHPLGVLQISQRAVPLNLRLDKIGNQKAADAHQFSVDVSSAGLQKSSNVREKFAIAQYQNLSDADKLSRPAFQDADGGVELSSTGQQLGSSKVVTRVVRYEVIYIDNNFKRFAVRWFSQLGVLFNHFLAGAAVSRSPLSYAVKKTMTPYGLEERIKIAQPGYAVVGVSDNKALGQTAVFASEAQARDFLHAHLELHPNLTEQIHVIPSFEAVMP
jgi:hypothetical protein